MAKALQSRDQSALHRLLAPDFVFIHPSSGAREPLALFLARVLNGQTPFSSGLIEKYDVDVKLIGDSGAILTETVNLQNGGRSRWYTFTSIWRKGSDVWQVVQHHSTTIGDGVVETPELLASYNRIAGEYRRSDGGRWNGGPSLGLSIRKDGKRLLMFGLFGQRDRLDPVLPQGGLEFEISRFRVKFSLDGTGTATSITATEDGKVSWTATRVPTN
jgi:ketosteroid isomerase-like protein